MSGVKMATENATPSSTADESKICVVLGGRGFIGRSLVARLLRLGNWIVRIADSTPSILLGSDESALSQALESGRASYYQVDVRNRDQIVKAVEGALVVFYTNTVDSSNGDFYFYYTTIVQGVKNVINACKDCKVKQLIHNSPADIVFESGRDIDKGDESKVYAGKFGSVVTDLNAQAEGLVLRANDIDGLLTCSIRSSNVFGPGDKQLVPLLVQMAKSVWAKFIIGSGKKLTEFTYVENVAHANICAEEALSSKMVSVSGKAYFISNLEPLNFWEFNSSVLDGLGYQRPTIKLPDFVVKYFILVGKWLHLNMDFTFVQKVSDLSLCTRTLDCSAAKKHIGYSPIISLQEGITLTVESFSHLAQVSTFTKYKDSGEQSKADKILGSGKVADILLWRDETESFTYFLSLALFYYWFFLLGRTFISSVAMLLLLVAVLLSFNCFLPANIFGMSFPRVPSSYFEISEETVRTSFSIMGYIWNSGCHLMGSFARGEDWHTFIMMVALLYSFKMAATHCLTLSIGCALVVAFNAFFIYEQYEEEIDGVVTSLFIYTRKSGRWLLMNLPRPLASRLPDRFISVQKTILQ
ncbi:OLC1v1008367C1 [Oldenlandia corymbosa var. corymbosa]|uniref:Reticulon-like protein n=1 Tax=Oldenlandia corymbosa var. corymbosa TaxID=529605 RepID=A0AAV1DNX4_OLDCO|nr:OLC1v1008367C1 [Oldenlandia corymbosa var. corymbosa]